jgi:hypothetical protein
MLAWDVNNGVGRRAWSGNQNAQYQIAEAMKLDPLLKVTMPVQADDALLEAALALPVMQTPISPSRSVAKPRSPSQSLSAALKRARRSSISGYQEEDHDEVAEGAASKKVAKQGE